ncbi:hypothetical protein BH10CHL1_BH10CHL1_37240 [soil metagenome]
MLTILRLVERKPLVLKRFITIFLLLASLLIAACNGRPMADKLSTASIDMNRLPALIDAQTANTLRIRRDVLLLDVREQWEYDQGHIPGML